MLQANTEFIKKFQGKISVVKKEGYHGYEDIDVFTNLNYRLMDIPEETVEEVLPPVNYESEDQNSMVDAEETLKSAISLLTSSSSKASLLSNSQANFDSPEKKFKDLPESAIVNDKGLDMAKPWSGEHESRKLKLEPIKNGTVQRKIPKPPAVSRPKSRYFSRKNRYCTKPKEITDSSNKILDTFEKKFAENANTGIYDNNEEAIIDGDRLNEMMILENRGEIISGSHVFKHLDRYSDNFFSYRQKEALKVIKTELRRKQYAEKIRQDNRIHNVRSNLLIEQRINQDEIRKQSELKKLQRRIEYGNKVTLAPIKAEIKKEVRKPDIMKEKFKALQIEYLQKKQQVDEIRRDYAALYYRPI